MPAKQRIPTKFDKEKDRNDVKALVFQGHKLCDAARIVGVGLSAAKAWSARENWTEEMARIQQLAKRGKPSVTLAEKVIFDRVRTGRKTRNLLMRTAHRVAKWTLEEAKERPEVIYETAASFKAMTESTAKLDGTWDDSSASKFAVNIQLNALASKTGAIRELTAAEVEAWGGES